MVRVGTRATGNHRAVPNRAEVPENPPAELHLLYHAITWAQRDKMSLVLRSCFHNQSSRGLGLMLTARQT